jgi:hypothetical protein
VPTAELSATFRDLYAASKAMDRDQARILVGMRMTAQEHRIALGNQASAADRNEKPNVVLQHFAGLQREVEDRMDKELTRWAKEQPLGQWMLAQHGIGGVFAAGLLAHVDWETTVTASRVWRFAGLDPTVKWGKGERRPWNADLKRLMWLIGESFKKQSGREAAFYGQYYRQQKAKLVEKNDAGGNAELAAADLEARGARMTADQRAHYEAGKLPPGRIDLQATRKARKLFLSHAVYVATTLRGGDPAMPWAIALGGHADFIYPPLGGPYEGPVRRAA